MPGHAWDSGLYFFFAQITQAAKSFSNVFLICQPMLDVVALEIVDFLGGWPPFYIKETKYIMHISHSMIDWLKS